MEAWRARFERNQRASLKLQTTRKRHAKGDASLNVVLTQCMAKYTKAKLRRRRHDYRFDRTVCVTKTVMALTKLSITSKSLLAPSLSQSSLHRSSVAFSTTDLSQPLSFSSRYSFNANVAYFLKQTLALSSLLLESLLGFRLSDIILRAPLLLNTSSSRNHVAWQSVTASHIHRRVKLTTGRFTTGRFTT